MPPQDVPCAHMCSSLPHSMNSSILQTNPDSKHPSITCSMLCDGTPLPAPEQSIFSKSPWFMYLWVTHFMESTNQWGGNVESPGSPTSTLTPDGATLTPKSPTRLSIPHHQLSPHSNQWVASLYTHLCRIDLDLNTSFTILKCHFLLSQRIFLNFVHAQNQ